MGAFAAPQKADDKNSSSNSKAARAVVQPKLEIGAPDDAFEQEADAMAEKVVNGIGSGAGGAQSGDGGPGDTGAGGTPTLQRWKQAPKLQRMDDLDSPKLQRMDGLDKPRLQRVDSLDSPKIQRMTEDEEGKIQRRIEEEEDHAEKTMQRKEEDEPIQRMSDEDEAPIQRKIKSEEDEAEGLVQTKLDKEGDGPRNMMQRDADSSTNDTGIQRSDDGTMLAGADTSAKIKGAKGKGSSMDESTKSEMEKGFGQDFSNVNIHADSEAGKLSKEVGAKAFTTGQDIFFKPENYKPDTKEGKTLLAHELTHTVQQRGGNVQQLQREKEDHDYNKSEVKYLRDILKIYPDLTPTEVMDQSIVPAVVIMKTEEFKSLMHPNYNYQTKYNFGSEVGVRVCREILKELLKSPRTFSWEDDTEALVRKIINTSDVEYEETEFGSKPLTDLYKTLYDTFKSKIKDPEKDFSKIETAVTTYGTELWEKSMGRPDDKELFWARVQGRMCLKKNTELTKDERGMTFLGKLNKILDETSRGQRSVNFADDPKDKNRRILVSGFDPWRDGVPSNTSGMAAQMLDGTTFSYTEMEDVGGVMTAKSKTGYIEGVTFSVRYDDFDKGKVENFFKEYIDPRNGHNIFAIVTISLDNNKPEYDFERHASRNRRATAENTGISTAGLQVHDSADDHVIDVGALLHNVVIRGLDKYAADASIDPKDWKFAATAIHKKIMALFPHITLSSPPTMPATIGSGTEAFDYLKKVLIQLNAEVKKVQQGSMTGPGEQYDGSSTGDEFYTTKLNLDNVDLTGASWLEIDDKFTYYDPAGVVQPGNSATVPADAQRTGAAKEGSGGDYLSNEIYYRVSNLGANLKDDRGNPVAPVPNVHLHIPEVDDDATDGIDPNRIDNATVAANVREAIKRLVEGEINP